MLVWITLTHLPTSASAYVNQPFGFISAAEGFIFLSALFTGRIYFRLAEHDGYRAMTRKMWGRTVRLYGYHALLLAFVFLVAVPIASRGNRPGLHNLLDFYFMAGPKQAITEAALLIYRPPLLDILPLYIIFLAMSSILILLARRFGWKPILCGSFAFWVLAQFGFRAAEHTFMMHYIPTRIPIHEMGAFDLWAWQFLWIVGIWLGVRWAQDNLPIEAERAESGDPGGGDRRGVLYHAALDCTWFSARRNRVAIRQMASGAAAASRFRGGGRGADRWATLVKTPGSAAAGADGPIFAAGVLRPSALLLCRTHAYGQCVHVKRLAAIRALGRNVRCDAGHRKAFLEERSQARAPAEDFPRSWNANHLAAAARSCFRRGCFIAFGQK